MPNIVTQERFINEALEAHNAYRTMHGVSPLEHEPRLSSLAKQWAENLAQKNKLEYKNTTYKDVEVGENILRFKLNETNSYYLSGEDATDEWYNEESDYDYSGKFSATTGHFTQLVWKSTQKVGFGFALDDTGVLYVVANYFPAGNYKKKFLENVLPVPSVNTRLMPFPSVNTRLMPPIGQPQAVHKDGFLKDMMRQIMVHKNNAVDDSIGELDESIESKNNVEFDQVQMKFINEALSCHNRCRRKHGVSELKHNPELSVIAQSYADKLAKMNKMVHSKNKYNGENIGENLAYSYDSRLNYYSGEKASMQWYDEIHDHNFNQDHQRGTGHFTQLVWKTTREVGFGIAEAKDGSFYAVANYYPAGNFVGRFVQNVPRPL